MGGLRRVDKACNMRPTAKTTDFTKKKKKNSGRCSGRTGKSSLLILSEVKDRTKRKQRFRFWRMRIIAGKKTSM